MSSKLIDILEESVKDIEKFKKTGKTTKEIVAIKVELEGIEAVQFRTLMRVCDKGKEYLMVEDIIKHGVSAMAFQLVDSVANKLIGGYMKRRNKI